MEFVRLKYANNQLIDASVRGHREVINEYVEKKGYDYVGFVPIVFGPNGRPLEVDFVFKKRVERIIHPAKPPVVNKASKILHPVQQSSKPVVKPSKPEPVVEHKPESSQQFNDLYNDRGLDLILNGGDDDLLGEEK